MKKIYVVVAGLCTLGLFIGVVGADMGNVISSFDVDHTAEWTKVCKDEIVTYNQAIPDIELACRSGDKVICVQRIRELCDKTNQNISLVSMGLNNVADANIEDALDELGDASVALRSAKLRSRYEGAAAFGTGEVHSIARTLEAIDEMKEHVEAAEELIGKSSLKNPGKQTPMVFVIGVIPAILVAIGISKRKRNVNRK